MKVLAVAAVVAAISGLGDARAQNYYCNGGWDTGYGGCCPWGTDRYYPNTNECSSGTPYYETSYYSGDYGSTDPTPGVIVLVIVVTIMGLCGALDSEEEPCDCDECNPPEQDVIDITPEPVAIEPPQPAPKPEPKSTVTAAGGITMQDYVKARVPQLLALMPGMTKSQASTFAAEEYAKGSEWNERQAAHDLEGTA